jgi:hypothetical protein
MRPAGCPLHLLLRCFFTMRLLITWFTVDSNEGRADRLAVSVAFAEVPDELLIVAGCRSRIRLYPWPPSASVAWEPRETPDR